MSWRVSICLNVEVSAPSYASQCSSELRPKMSLPLALFAAFDAIWHARPPSVSSAAHPRRCSAP